ncbi:carboxypeptidase-like regulatory domain-containing protein, partial [Winogradskyella vincentii]
MKNFTKSPNLFLVLLFSLLTITSCQKDDGPSMNDGEQQENVPDNFSEYFGNDVSKNFLGTVIDDDKDPIEGVTITIGNETATTDSNGVFIINNATVKERFGYIKALKEGYIHGSRAVVPSNGTNKVTIMLLEASITGTISSGNAETVTSDDGSSVSFDGNFVKEDGTEYTGSVDVIMHHLDPADEDMPMQMPGMLYAQNEAGAERMLQTLGMLAVEL